MKRYLTILSCVIWLISCDSLNLSSDCDVHTNIESIKADQIITDGRIVLGEKLANPYSLKNMQRALDTLLQTKGLDPIYLEPTDAYVRFRPTDTLEYRLLMEANLELFDYPLNYDLLTDGDYYHDPSIPEDEITWQYTVISTDMIDTDIEYEKIDFEIIDEDDLPEFYLITGNPVQVSGRIIDACYFPENDPIVKSGNRLPVSPEELENMAFELVDLPDKYKVAPDTKASDYTPSGYVKISYNTMGTDCMTGVKGVKVRVQRLLKWASTYTSSIGYFMIPKKFGTTVNLSIVYENDYNFIVWGNYGFLAPAKYTFKDCIAAVPMTEILDKEKTKKAWKWAIVNNSTYDYYNYCSTEGISQPPADLKIWCVNTDGWSSAPMLHHLKGYKIASMAAGVAFLSGNPALATIGAGVIALLCVALPDLFIDISSDEYDKIDSNVKHELSHASHYSVVGEGFWGKYINYIVTHWGYGNGEATTNGRYICELGESWAYAHQRYLMPGYNYGYSNWFAPSVDAIELLLEDGCISPGDYFAQLKYNTYNINDVHANLITEHSVAKGKIDMAFAVAGVLDSQAQWKIENKTDTCIRVRIKRSFYSIGESLQPNSSVTIAGVNTSNTTASYNTFKYNLPNRPTEIIIGIPDSLNRIVDTIYHESRLESTYKLGREMSRESNWKESTSSNHEREIKAWTYTIKPYDIGALGNPVKGEFSGYIPLN